MGREKSDERFSDRGSGKVKKEAALGSGKE